MFCHALSEGVSDIWDEVVGEFTEDQAIFAFIKELHCVCWDWIVIANVWTIFDYLQRIYHESAPEW